MEQSRHEAGVVKTSATLKNLLLQNRICVTRIALKLVSLVVVLLIDGCHVMSLHVTYPSACVDTWILFD